MAIQYVQRVSQSVNLIVSFDKDSLSQPLTASLKCFHTINLIILMLLLIKYAEKSGQLCEIMGFINSSVSQKLKVAFDIL